MKKLHLFRVAIVVLGAGILLATPLASAAKNSGSGIKFSPVRFDTTINPGQTKTLTVNVQNVTGADVTYKAVVNDFVAKEGNETGQPNLLLNPGQYAPSHSLKRFVGPISNVMLKPDEQKSVKINITVPKDAAGGGYYGVVRFVPTDSSKGRNVTLSASGGPLILIRVPGDIKDDLRIASFDVRSSETADVGSSFFTSNGSLYATVRFTNKGNVQEEPYGKVVLQKGDKVLQTTEINNSDPRGNVLPGSVRRFSVKLDKVGSWGKYTVKGYFGYGNSGQSLNATTTFYVIPLWPIIIAIIIIVLILLAIFGLPRAIKSYNRRVVSKSKSSGRR